MASPKKICLVCGGSLSGRKDAKTCSDICRKRLQRARYLLRQESAELKQVVDKAEDSLVSLEKKLVPTEVNEAGFIGSFIPVTAKPATPQNYNPPAPPLADGSALDVPPESDALDRQPEVIDQSPTQMPIRRHWWKRPKVSGLALSMLAMVIILGSFSAWLYGHQHQTIVVKPAAANLSDGLTPADFKNKKLSINFDTTVTGGKSLTLTGPVVIQNDSDSTGVFKIQSADGNNILAADTIHNQINIGDSPSGQVSLSVKGNISTNGSLVSTTNGYSLGNTGLSIGGKLICNANGCTPAGSSGAYIQLQAGIPGSQQTGNANISGTIIAGQFSGSGLGLSNLDASQLATGTVNDSRLSSNVTLQGNTFNSANQLIQATNLGYYPVLNGSLITNLNASAITSGTLDDLRLAADVPLTGSNNNFSGANSFASAITIPGFKTTNNSHVINVGFTNTSTGNLTFDFDLSSTPGTYTICTVESGNCTAPGTGIAGIGTIGKIAKFIGTQTLADSIISDNGITVDVAGNFNATTITQNSNTVCDVSGNCAGIGGQVGTFGSPTAGTIALFHGSATIENSILTQSGSTVTAAGNLNVTSGNFYQVNGVQVTSAILSNDVNLAKLDANQIFTGNNTFSGTTNINNSGSATTTIGALTNTNLILQDSDWNVTGAGAATFASITNNGTYNGNTFTSSALAFSANSGATINANGANTISIGGTSTGDILLGGGSSSTGCTLTNSSGDFTCTGNITGAATGTAGYWSRSGITLQPATAGDFVTTSGNISTTGSGTITSAGLLTASSGLTATGIAQINNSGSSATNIAVSGTGTLGLGNTTGATTLTGASGSSSIAFGNFTVSSAGAIVGVGVNSGSGQIQGAAGINVSGSATLAGTAGNTLTIGNSTGAGTIASGGTSAWTNTAGNLTIQTVTSGSINLTASGASNTGIIAKVSSDSTAAFQVQNSTNNAVLTVDTSGGNVVIGTGSTGEATPKLLVLDKSTSDAQPSCTSGAIYYNGNTTNSTVAKGIWGCVNGTWYTMANYASVADDTTAGGSETWAIPYGVTTVTVLACGGGGGGGHANNAIGGAGGGGGAFRTMTFKASTIGSAGASITYVVGASGSAGTVTNGGNGGATLFGSSSAATAWLVAGGGGGGLQGSGGGGGGGASGGGSGATAVTSTPGTPAAFGNTTTSPYNGNGIGAQAAYGGTTAIPSVAGGNAEYGGGGGGGGGSSSSPSGSPGAAGGSSEYAAGGGGGGGGEEVALFSPNTGGAGGKTNAYTASGGGAAGNVGAGGANGSVSSNAVNICGNGAGGGGAQDGAGNAGAGGTGYEGSGGGGGGGAGNGGTAASGGAGGAGRIVIVAW